jgi:hypothetical protein
MENHHVLMGKSTISEWAMASVANCNKLPEGIFISV